MMLHRSMGIMKDFYVHIVLKDRSFKVWMGSTFSDHHPQGSILSVNLFSVKIISIAQCLNPCYISTKLS